MTENQKLREALQGFLTAMEQGLSLALAAEYARQALALPTDVPETNFGKIREALLAYHRATTFNERLLASAKADEALALPTAEQVDDINVAESFTSVTKTAAPVGDLPELPEPAAWRTPDEWPMCYQYTHEEPDAERIQWAARYGRKHEQVFTADQMRAYARAALSAGDAADAQRYRWLREQHWSNSDICCVNKPKQNVRLGGMCPSGDLLDAVIDAALRKGQL